MRIFKGLASVHVDHGVGVVCAAVLSSNEVTSSLRITGAGARRKTGWLGHGTGVFCNIMPLLCSKGLLLVVRLGVVAGDSSGIDFFHHGGPAQRHADAKAETLSEVMGAYLLGGLSPSELVGECSPS